MHANLIKSEATLYTKPGVALWLHGYIEPRWNTARFTLHFTDACGSAEETGVDWPTAWKRLHALGFRDIETMLRSALPST